MPESRDFRKGLVELQEAGRIAGKYERSEKGEEDHGEKSGGRETKKTLFIVV